MEHKYDIKGFPEEEEGDIWDTQEGGAMIAGSAMGFESPAQEEQDDTWQQEATPDGES